MEDVAPLISLGLIVYVVVNFAKAVMNKNLNALATLVLAWVGGLGVSWLASESDFGGGITYPGTDLTFADMNFASLALVGLAIAAVAAFGFDTLKALNSSDTSTPDHLLD